MTKQQPFSAKEARQRLLDCCRDNGITVVQEGIVEWRNGAWFVQNWHFTSDRVDNIFYLLDLALDG